MLSCLHNATQIFPLFCFSFSILELFTSHSDQMKAAFDLALASFTKHFDIMLDDLIVIYYVVNNHVIVIRGFDWSVKQCALGLGDESDSMANVLATKP